MADDGRFLTEPGLLTAAFELPGLALCSSTLNRRECAGKWVCKEWAEGLQQR